MAMSQNVLYHDTWVDVTIGHGGLQKIGSAMPPGSVQQHLTSRGSRSASGGFISPSGTLDVTPALIML